MPDDTDQIGKLDDRLRDVEKLHERILTHAWWVKAIIVLAASAFTLNTILPSVANYFWPTQRKTPQIDVQDSNDDKQYTDAAADGSALVPVTFQFPFDVVHAWVELTEHIGGSPTPLAVIARKPAGQRVVVDVISTSNLDGKTYKPGNRLRFRVWATNF